MKEIRGPITEKRLRQLMKWFEKTGNLKNRSRSGRPKLSAESTKSTV